MAYSMRCKCNEDTSGEIDSITKFEQIRRFFQRQVEQGIYEEVPVKKPYYVWRFRKYYADKWYRCKEYGCLWEIIYPDLPTNRSVNKFPHGRGFIWGEFQISPTSTV